METIYTVNAENVTPPMFSIHRSWYGAARRAVEHRRWYRENFGRETRVWVNRGVLRP